MSNTLETLDGLVTRPTFARLLGVNPETVSKLAATNPRFPQPVCVQATQGRGWWRWRRSDVVAFLTERGEVAHAQ